MKGRKHTPEQIVRKLREGERMIAEGKSVGEVAKALEVSDYTYVRWRNQYVPKEGFGRAICEGARNWQESERETGRESGIKLALSQKSLAPRTSLLLRSGRGSTRSLDAQAIRSGGRALPVSCSFQCQFW